MHSRRAGPVIAFRMLAASLWGTGVAGARANQATPVPSPMGHHEHWHPAAPDPSDIQLHREQCPSRSA